MTAMPEMVALFNGFGGIASASLGAEMIKYSQRRCRYESDRRDNCRLQCQLSVGRGVTVATRGLIGSVTFWGSLVAYRQAPGRSSAFKKRIDVWRASKLLNVVAGPGGMPAAGLRWIVLDA
jgi:NAD(P) transhydrogenase subunit beta